MRVLGCDLRWPSFYKLTLAVLFGVVMWGLLAIAGLYGGSPVIAGGALGAGVFGTVAAACGVDPWGNWRGVILIAVGSVPCSAVGAVLMQYFG